MLRLLRSLRKFASRAPRATLITQAMVGTATFWRWADLLHNAKDILHVSVPWEVLWCKIGAPKFWLISFDVEAMPGSAVAELIGNSNSDVRTDHMDQAGTAVERRAFDSAPCSRAGYFLPAMVGRAA